MKTKNETKGFYWHVHHDKLCEYCYDYDERVNYIKNDKPQNEIQTRLRLMKPVREELPKELVEADKKWDEANKKCVEACKKWNEADKKWGEAYKKCNEAYKKGNEADKEWYEAYEKYAPQLEALHKKECGCKEWNGKELVFK
jgi:hypothetical protein